MYKKNDWPLQEGGNWGMDSLMRRQISAFLHSGLVGRALDYGAGNSPYRHILSCERYITADVTQHLTGDIDYLIVPGERLPIDDESLDFSLLLDVLEHVPDFILSEIRRLLVPNGCLIINVPFIYREHETPHDFARYTVFEMRELVRQQKGTVVRTSKVGNVSYTLLSLLLERGIAMVNRLGLPGRVLNRVLRTPLPLLSMPLQDNDGIYHHLAA